MALLAPERATARVEPVHPWRERLQGRTDLVLCLALVCVTLVVHGVNVGGWPVFFDDEGTYLSQAFATYDGELAPYTYWYDHPPVGWLQLAALSWLPNLFVDTPIVAGRLTMVLYAAVSTALLYGIARRLHLRRGFAVAGCVLWLLSPLTVLEARQVFLDSLAVPWLLGALFLALSPARHLGHYAASGFCLGVAVLTKETTVLFLPALLVAIVQGSHRGTRAFALSAFGFAVLVTGGAYLLFAVLKGELLPGPGHVSLVDALLFQLTEREGSGFILREGSGAYGVLQYWLGHDRVLVVGGTFAALLAAAVRDLRPPAVAVLAAVVLAMRPDGYLPFMYVAAVLPFAALVIAGVADRGWSLVERQAGRTPALRWVAGAAALALLVPVASGWARGLEPALTDDANAAHAPAVEWMETNADPNSVVVTDNVLWLDLAEAGWEPGWGVVWFTKLDLDPLESRRQLANGWRDVDYVVWSTAFPQLGDDRMPIVQQLHDHSEVVATFGDPENRVEIRRVVK